MVHVWYESEYLLKDVYVQSKPISAFKAMQLQIKLDFNIYLDNTFLLYKDVQSTDSFSPT